MKIVFLIALTAFLTTHSAHGQVGPSCAASLTDRELMAELQFRRGGGHPSPRPVPASVNYSAVCGWNGDQRQVEITSIRTDTGQSRLFVIPILHRDSTRCSNFASFFDERLNAIRSDGRVFAVCFVRTRDDVVITRYTALNDGQIVESSSTKVRDSSECSRIEREVNERL